jgi:hypothetical protein
LQKDWKTEPSYKRIKTDFLEKQKKIAAKEFVYNLDIMINQKISCKIIEYFGPKEEDYGSMYYAYEKEEFKYFLQKNKQYINPPNSEFKYSVPSIIIMSDDIAKTDEKGIDTEEIKLILLKIVFSLGGQLDVVDYLGRPPIILAENKGYSKIVDFLGRSK